MAPPDFGRSVNPISTKGGRSCPPNNIGTPGFSDLPTALQCNGKREEPLWCIKLLLRMTSHGYKPMLYGVLRKSYVTTQFSNREAKGVATYC